MQKHRTAVIIKHVKEDYAVIVIDNTDIAKPVSRELERETFALLRGNEK